MLGRHIDTSLKGAAKGKVYILYIYTRVRARKHVVNLTYVLNATLEKHIAPG